VCNNQTTARHRKNTGIVLPNAQVIQDVKDGSYKYHGVLEADQIKQGKLNEAI